ncbi:sulfite reductase (NADPH) beta subunit [Singulisphaera sp. GP187]|uniref:NADPH-dependent assimilatory sulfite reductase hemoprotein subunit n=1 Tax=Singulisphaera sp. GP187 TaxID=1882752 RepID=UPI00092A3B7F|nr:NADPH-dependent assimilatory sulfite reductase hemoprotein subunit [Singulisphaera sp. GP187]SIO57626.1 sulfite reductase (NADPH) beta subunit [Singulisphaera sp. GP187]
MDQGMSDGRGDGAAKKKPPSKAEAVKVASQYLRTFVADEIGNGRANFSEDAAAVLKFHGSYQQDDRDVRSVMKREGREKEYQLMVRVRMPGGKLATAAQYLTVANVAETAGNGTLRITTRQEFQIHGVVKADLPATIRAINESLLSTLAACGDVERNVLCCPAPLCDGIRTAMQADADRWASHVAPRSSSYWDIWLDGERIANPLLPQAGPVRVPTAGDDPVEPIYGKAYLPRKFKTAFALPEDNCTDIHANDLGFLAVVEAGKLVGYNVLVGGGLGTTPSAQKTFPFLAVPLGSIDRADVLDIAEAVIKVFRDFGNRSDRKRARLKYLIHDWGVPAFRAKVEEYLGRPLADPKPVCVTDVDDHLGWHEQGDGKLFLGIPVENGRIKDSDGHRLFSGLKTFFETYGTPARLTCQQKILLVDLDPAWKPKIEAWLLDYGIAAVEQVSTVRRWSMACPAFPTCGLAVTEAERALPTIMDELEVELDRLGLGAERFTVRMTGCPNGCARPYNADVGLVGRSASRNPDGTPGPGTYTIFLGGRTTGDRLNVVFKDYVPFDRVVAELVPVFARFKGERTVGETFGDFCNRVEIEEHAGNLSPA